MKIQEYIYENKQDENILSPFRDIFPKAQLTYDQKNNEMVISAGDNGVELISSVLGTSVKDIHAYIDKKIDIKGIDPESEEAEWEFQDYLEEFFLKALKKIQNNIPSGWDLSDHIISFQDGPYFPFVSLTFNREDDLITTQMQSVWYHVSPASNASEIIEHGLTPSDSRHIYVGSYKERLYFFDPKAFKNNKGLIKEILKNLQSEVGPKGEMGPSFKRPKMFQDIAIFKVNIPTGTKIYEDKTIPDGIAVFIKNAIPKQNISLIYKGSIDNI